MSKIVLTTLGSLGDLHPFIAIALRLEAHGHDVVLGASPEYREAITGEGLAFQPVGPSRDEVLRGLGMDVHELGRRIVKDTMVVLEVGAFPYLKAMYDDLQPALDGASLVLTSSLMFSARLAAEKRGLPHMTVALQPMVFVSAYDPPAVQPMTWLAPVLAKLGPTVTRAVYGAAKKLIAPRARAVSEFRRELGLPDTRENPLFEGQFPAFGTLAMYSSVLGGIQPDFPPNTTIAGFTFYDQVTRERSVLAADLERFLSAGPPPVIFTLGSFAVEFPGDFYRVSRDVARRLKRRAVLLVGAGRVESYREAVADNVANDVFVCDYAPFSELFSRAAAVVHHGGIGTTGQALRAGRPQIIVPFLSDQFDNAARIVRLGVGRTVALKRYEPRHVAAELSSLLGDSSYASRAAVVGEQVSKEDGAEVAACVIDKFLGDSPRLA
jgi:rhamnosyltransferase subunit B